MMSYLVCMFFLIPLALKNMFWSLILILIIISFFFLMDFSYGSLYINLSYFMGMDMMSFLLIMLSFWICFLMIMASEKIFNNLVYSSFFLFILIVLLISLYLTFSSMNFFFFYLFFEVSLIPTLILIMGWGYQPERLQAGIYLLFYTLFASLPMMISLFYCFILNNSLEFIFLVNQFDNFLFYLCINMVFFIKIPMFFVHLWLPKAHVEAPISGSMILAGVMLKLGGYGLLRVMMMFSLIGMKINLIFISLSLLGGVIVSLICLRQSDIKLLVAYSSVSHMGLVLSGICSMNYWGLTGSLIMMLAHGLCSSGLFCLANITYERLLSRSLYLNKGLMNLIPSLSLWWFLLISSNMAAPPSLNLLSEIMLINSIMSFSFYNMFFLCLVSFFSAVYSLYLYSFSQHGIFYSGVYSFFTGSIREYLLLFLHWVPLNLLIMKGEFFTLWV